MENEALDARSKLNSWLGRNMRIKMSDGRTLVGQFLCTDKQRNVILGSAQEYFHDDDDDKTEEDPRILGLAMIPGKHIKLMKVDID